MQATLTRDQFDTLPREEQQELAKRARRGDQDAYERLCEANMRYAMKCVARYRWSSVPEKDLEGAALLGLSLGMREYDPARHLRPIAYVKHRIQDEIRREIRKNGRTVRLPHHIRVRLRKIDRARERLRQELQRAPKASEISGELPELNTNQVVDALRRRHNSDSLDELFTEDDDEGRTLLDVIKDSTVSMPDREYIQEELQMILDRLLSYLPDRQEKILRLMVGADVERDTSKNGGHDGLVLPADIAQRFDVSRSRVQQLKRKALSTLCDWMTERQFSIQ